MQFQAGDKVRLVDEPGEGVVLRHIGKQVLAEIDGIEMLLDQTLLVKVEFDGLINRVQTHQEFRAKDKLKQIEAKTKLSKFDSSKDAVYELDLHMHELLDRYEYMTNGQRLEYQMQRCRAFVREAVERKYRKVILIHGVGEGVLRTEIHKYLDSLDRVEYHDAPYRTYGYGATEVIIR